ncbi:MAG: hypothetical protein AAFX81_11040 [Pseudomonadota bacterium]
MSLNVKRAPTRPILVVALLLGATAGVAGCNTGTTFTRSVGVYDPLYYDDRYRAGIYAHHRAYRPGYRAPRYRPYF